MANYARTGSFVRVERNNPTTDDPDSPPMWVNLRSVSRVYAGGAVTPLDKITNIELVETISPLASPEDILGVAT